MIEGCFVITFKGFNILKHRFWQLQYAQQGKRYPSPKKRKSKARMSKKWREL